MLETGLSPIRVYVTVSAISYSINGGQKRHSVHSRAFNPYPANVEYMVNS